MRRECADFLLSPWFRSFIPRFDSFFILYFFGGNPLAEHQKSINVRSTLKLRLGYLTQDVPHERSENQVDVELTHLVSMVLST